MTEAILDIVSLAAGGHGVARHDGLVVFTPRTAPGDRIRAEVTVSGRIGRGNLVALEHKGQARIEPECNHYLPPDRCGGCQWQHIEIHQQREAKRVIVRDAFARIAGRDVDLPEIRSGGQWRYRRTLTLAIRRNPDGSVYAGLRAYDDPESIFALTDCLITAPAVVAAWRAILAAGDYLPGEMRMRGTVRLIDDRPHFTLEGAKEWPRLARFLEHVPDIAAIWWQPHGKRRRMIADRRTAAEPGASFAQVNSEMAGALRSEVVRRVVELKPEYVIDAYSGAGDTAALLAAEGVRVTAVESDEEAAAFAARRLPGGSRSVNARVEDVIASLLPADVVIVNPPRSGCDRRVMEAIAHAESQPRALFYVSCDPATLARDVSRLKGWKLHDIVCFDLFPQTSHVETLCELRPEVV